MRTTLITVALTVQLAGLGAARADYPIRPVPFTAVHLQDAFWAPRLHVNRQVSIPYAFRKCEETGRIANFVNAGGKNRAGVKPARFQGYYFNDSDVYKVIEGAAYALAVRRDPKLDAYLDDLIAKIAAAQEPDGYLYTARTLCGDDYMPPGGRERWSDLGGGHELYCVGHLYEAAAAHYQATGKRTLLDVALKNADLVCRVFGPGRNTHPDGHPEVEMGLVKLFRVTGNRKYLDQARFFLDTRGRADGRGLYGEYAQDHVPVLKQTKAVGHAVRAAYLYSGMADIAALQGDAAYRRAVETLWQDVASTKLYLTGGIGARGGGEAFGPAYELPNRTAYAETCAAIANGLLSHRMFLLNGDSAYADVMERALYNGFLSGVSLSGDHFFYTNPLESFRGSGRYPWFDCACCPPNVVRFMEEVPGFVYATRGESVYVNLYVGCTASFAVGGQALRVRQETRYPWDGAVKLTVSPARPRKMTLLLRIPDWARHGESMSGLYRFVDDRGGRREGNWPLKVNGREMSVPRARGYAVVTRVWRPGDTVALDLPMPVRRVVARDEVLDDRNRVALQRGPIVYCAEGVDNPGGRVLEAVLPDAAPLTAAYRPDLLGGVVAIAGQAREAERGADGTPVLAGTRPLTAVPYYAWANRKPGQMAVWLARTVTAARPLPGPTLAFRSKVTTSGGTGVEALNDQLEPRSSIDHSNPFFHWWPRKGTREWVEYDFPQPTRVSEVEVYWFDDTGIGECRLPQSWRVMARVGGEWHEVTNPSGYGVEKDRYNRCTFEPVTAEALRLDIQLPANYSAGIHEWRVK